MESKVCSKCGIDKPFDQYGKAKLGKFGLRAICKACKFIQDKEWAENNRDKRSDSVRKYAKANKVKVKAAKKKWEKSNPEKHKAIKDRWAEKYPEVKREAANKYRKKVVDKLEETYIKDKLVRQQVPITPETIELKKDIISIKRLIKKQNGKTNTTTSK